MFMHTTPIEAQLKPCRTLLCKVLLKSYTLRVSSIRAGRRAWAGLAGNTTPLLPWCKQVLKPLLQQTYFNRPSHFDKVTIVTHSLRQQLRSFSS